MGKTPPNKKVQVKGIHSSITYLGYVHSNVLVILGNKILNIPLVFQYNFGYYILLGNEFLKQFARFTNTTCTDYLTTKYDRTLQIPTLKHPCRVHAKRSRHGYDEISLRTKLKEDLCNTLKRY